MSKPAFNPNQPFEATSSEKPAFDPNKPFDSAESKPIDTTKKSGTQAEALGRGVAQGATFGFQDELEGVGGGLTRAKDYLLGNTKGDKGILDAIRTGYISDRDASRAYDQQLTKDNPVTSFAGQIASGLPSLGAKGAISLGSMIGQGGLSGFGNAEGDLKSQATDTAIGGSIGGVLGKGAELAGTGLNKAANSLKTNLGLIGLGSGKKAVTAMGENAPEIVQSAINSGAMNPLKTIAGQQAANQKVLQSSGKALGGVREQLPNVSLEDIQQAITKRSSHLDPLIDESAVAQIDKLNSAIKAKAYPDLSMEDLVGLKGKIGNSSRNTFGDVNKNKEGMDIVRQALRDVEVNSASKVAPEYRDFLKKSSSAHTVGSLLADKDAASKAGSLISLGGQIGTAAGAGIAASTGDPKALLLGAIFSKTGRDKLARSGAVSIDAVQKLATKLKIDPKVMAYLLSRQDAGE